MSKASHSYLRSVKDRSNDPAGGLALLAVLPAACCGLPFLLAAGAAAGTGALTGGITGAVLVAAGAGLAVVVLRRRTRSAAPPPRGPVDKGRDRDGSC